MGGGCTLQGLARLWKSKSIRRYWTCVVLVRMGARRGRHRARRRGMWRHRRRGSGSEGHGPGLVWLTKVGVFNRRPTTVVIVTKLRSIDTGPAKRAMSIHGSLWLIGRIGCWEPGHGPSVSVKMLPFIHASPMLSHSDIPTDSDS